MWLVIVCLLSVGLGILALIGLLVVAKELLRDCSLDANFADAEGATVRHDLDGRSCGRRYGLTR
jgi:hypothetical protein